MTTTLQAPSEIYAQLPSIDHQGNVLCHTLLRIIVLVCRQPFRDPRGELGVLVSLWWDRTDRFALDKLVWITVPVRRQLF